MTFPDNEYSAAVWIDRRADGNLTYALGNADKGDWYWWNGKCHELTDDRHVYSFISQLVIEMGTNVAMLDSAQRAFYRNLLKSSGERSLLTKVKRQLSVASDHYTKKDTRYIAMSDGYVLDLANLDADPLPPDKSRPITRLLGTTLADGYGIPVQFLAWLDTVLPDKEEQQLLQESAGAALLGEGDAKIIVHLVGGTNTGKSTYFKIMNQIFGSYAGTLPANAIVKNYGGGMNFEQHKARGVRFLSLSEPSTSRTDDSFLKNLSGGGDVITTAMKGRDAEEWYAECVFHIAANSVVKFETKDNAIVQRMAIVEFNHHIANKDVDPNFHRNLVDAEGEGILMWIVEGAMKYQKWGHVKIPDSVKQRGQNNVVESSSPLRWLHEALESGRYVYDVSIPYSKMAMKTSAYSAYEMWCYSEGERPIKSRLWLDEIENYHNIPVQNRGKRPGGQTHVWGLREVEGAQWSKL